MDSDDMRLTIIGVVAILAARMGAAIAALGRTVEGA